MRPSRIIVRQRAARHGGLVVGEPTPEGALVLAEALALSPGARVEVVEERSEALREKMRRAAYLVLPAACGELLPRELVEAFANGLPVIAARAGAVAEHIEPGRNGLLFEAGSGRDLARRMTWAEAFPEKMRQMGECAKADYRARFVADFSYPRLFGERRRAARL
jgi:glycosyltransferase involved in cell wall biosynthesis